LPGQGCASFGQGLRLEGRGDYERKPGREVGTGVGVPVVILDTAAAFRRGLAACLTESGFTPEEPEDLAAWASGGGRRGILVTVRPPHGWQPLSSLESLDPTVIVVALLVEATPDAYAQALRFGADGVVPWDAQPEAIVAVVQAALQGMLLLPVEVGRALAAGAVGLVDPEWITPEETEWLQLLSTGMTVHDLADKTGYSERAMFRFLAGLYGKMGVSNRTEAVLLASQRSLLG
jgi:DNA-binding NarL/FixJ family response regulator